MLDRMLDAIDPVAAVDRTWAGMSATAPAARLILHRDGRWLVTPGGAAVDCTRRRLLRRLLASLVAARVERAGEAVPAAALIAAGWPGERILPAAARNRVHVALHRLRGLGLEPWLEHVGDGWRLAPALEIELRGEVEPVGVGAPPRRATGA